ncbi:MAG: hypothetical protein EXX96DRAFT_201912 [Benjaminiella poitrasii]|nr:MAG: hypothetical protein EXX96DRAFT_201912 [Benjaminiella poitrasii]
MFCTRRPLVQQIFFFFFLLSAFQSFSFIGLKREKKASFRKMVVILELCSYTCCQSLLFDFLTWIQQGHIYN